MRSKNNYLLLEALIGLIFCFWVSVVVLMCVAMLQDPFFHFRDGSGAALQYMPVGYSDILWHPMHSSTTGRQFPSL
jgi:hypothetical protein